MASNRPLAGWKVTASGAGPALSDIFSIKNHESIMPRQELGNLAEVSVNERGSSAALCRTEFLLCLRALKILKQVVFSRSRISVGPLQTTLSIAGMLESSPSWTSVLHSLGLLLSCDTTEAYRKALISEREQATRGAIHEVPVDDRIITVQMDNFDILPVHSVKAASKSPPTVSGTATQSIMLSNRRKLVHNASNATMGMAGFNEEMFHWRTWSLVPSLSSRNAFISSLNSKEYQSVLTDFYDIEFVAISEKRSELLGTGREPMQYRRGNTEMAYKHQGVNFRTLLLSCFTPHGEMDSKSPELYEQDVLFVDVYQMNAADILTIHQKPALISELLRPGQPDFPRFVVVSGDQPTYKMQVNIWRKSLRESRGGISGVGSSSKTRVQEWLIPFPGFFHVEKQSLYPVCKEIIDCLGLQELAECAGRSRSQVDNILKHSHARNNRSLLFSVCAALIIHTTDMVQAECPDTKDHLEEILRRRTSTTRAKEISSNSVLLRCVTEKFTARTLSIGRLCRSRVMESFSRSPNREHFVSMILFTCLLPTVGFHALSRTAHTDVVESFWLTLNHVLHTTGHITYQELYMFYAFFRAAMPRVSSNDLFKDKPGAMVTRVPSFTAGLGTLYDSRGWTYVPLDEALEMLIIRFVKGMNVLILPYIESCGAWLLESSKARMKIRTITGASRSYRRTRVANTDAPGDAPGGVTARGIRQKCRAEQYSAEDGRVHAPEVFPYTGAPAECQTRKCTWNNRA